MPGIQDFTYLNYAHETTRGTPVAPTRKWLGDATGVLDVDPMVTFHETENYGRRSSVRRVTSQGENVGLKIRAEPTFDDLVLPLTQLKGAMTGAGGAADKTWAAAPGMAYGTFNLPEAYTFDVGDDVQNYRVQYVMFPRFTLSGGLGEVEKIAIEAFGQRTQKVAKASPADPASSPKLVGGLWQWKFAATFAGLPGASVVPNFVVDHKLTVETGLVWEHYQDGFMWGGQHVETSIGGALELTVESSALAISEFYDKWLSGTIDYVRMRNQSAVVLGGSFPSLQNDLAVLYEDVKPIASQRDGINLYKIKARLMDDGVNPPISPTLVCSLAAIP
jgi:hypothetical protein